MLTVVIFAYAIGFQPGLRTEFFKVHERVFGVQRVFWGTGVFGVQRVFFWGTFTQLKPKLRSETTAILPNDKSSATLELRVTNNLAQKKMFRITLGYEPII